MRMKETNFSIVLYESQCSNNCVFCHSKKLGNIEKNMDKELKKIDTELQQGKSIDKIEISGHDPGEYEGLPDFVTEIKIKTGASRISLFTHGKKLSEKYYLQRLIKSGINHFIIPIYGHMPMVHDSITKKKGSFIKTMEGINNIYQSGQKVSFQCLITRENQTYLKEFFYFLSGLKFSDFCRVGIPYYKNDYKEFRKSLPDFVKLKKQLSDALKVCQRIGFNLQLFNVPKCLLSFDYKNNINNTVPQKAYKYFNGGKYNVYRIEDGEVFPDYRIEGKIHSCKKCVYDNNCSGVYMTYINAKIFPFDPVLKK
jgi:MoaA/NifB/PqqE/SkfB family radical SAM enzyme